MEKRSIVHAVYADSLVFESNFGGAAVPGINPEVIERVQSVPAPSTAAVTSENAGTNDTTASRILH